ncbi:MAG TPA: ABC transporter permease, partial [Candidatus Acetothermia bacterium]|nr:ABC transporter permease [Candidatus Acetothermia bacterium]
MVLQSNGGDRGRPPRDRAHAGAVRRGAVARGSRPGDALPRLRRPCRGDPGPDRRAGRVPPHPRPAAGGTGRLREARGHRDGGLCPLGDRVLRPTRRRRSRGDVRGTAPGRGCAVPHRGRGCGRERRSGHPTDPRSRVRDRARRIVLHGGTAGGGEVRVALRHLLRNRRRTLLTLLAVLVPVYFLVLMFGFANANLRDMFETATQFDTGHAQIRAASTRARGEALPLMRDPSDALGVLREVEGVESWTVRLDLPALASAGERSRTIQVRGIVPEEIVAVSWLSDRLVGGSFLFTGAPGVLVGEELARLLGVEVGDEIVLLGAHPEAGLGAIRAPVVGVYQAPEATLGRTVVYADLAMARKLARSETAATAIVIRVASVESPRDQAALDRLVRDLRAALPAGYEVQDWRELVPMVATYMGLLTPALLIVGAVFFALGGLVVLNTIYLSVLERTRELGLILSLGA